MATTPATAPAIVLRNASRWYGEILGINRVTVDIHAGLTGLVGPNGSGKSTLMNLICGLLAPDQGEVLVFGGSAWNNPALRRRVGFCSQSDRFYEHFTGRQFLRAMLSLHGLGFGWARRAADAALARVDLSEAADRTIRTYSKGMRQRVKIALALAHQPEILILDEPFNGLDPLGRREMMRLLEDCAREGRTVVVSSHILHEIEQMTDRILMMSNGYVVAEGAVREVRDQLRTHPFRVFIRCTQPRRLAARLLHEPAVESAAIEDGGGLTLTTRDPDAFYMRLNEVVIDDNIDIDVVSLADESVSSIYTYLSGREHH